MATIASQAIPAQTEADDERLRELFWNRAALKKQFAELRDENHQLKEQLERHENGSGRAQQQLEELEVALADPVKAANAIIFYQLRDVWNLGNKKLEQMSTELTAHQRSHEQKHLDNRFEVSRQASLESIDSHIAKGQQRVDELQQRLTAMNESHAQLRGFWNYFKRRKLGTEIESLKTALGDVSEQVEQCKESRKAKAGETGPEVGEVSLAGKRKINLALIAIAQELYLHFVSRGVSTKAREASVRNLVDAKYGDIDHCRDLSAHMAERVQRLQSGNDLIVNIRKRTKFLEELTKYRDKKDLVPVASSFAQIALIGPNGSETEAHKAVSVNVLADEYWDITGILLG